MAEGTPRLRSADRARHEARRELDALTLGIGAVARAAPDSAALVTLRSALTFAELDRRQRKLAGFLRRSGLRPGDRIAIRASNRPEYLEVTIGALRTAIVPVPIHPLLTAPEIAYVLEDSGARWLFTDTPAEPVPGMDGVIVFGDAYERILEEAGSADIADVALGRPMHYTSGTTGEPKGVWVAPLDQTTATRASQDFITTWSLSSDDVHLVLSSLAHSAPHRFSMRTLEAGGLVILPPRFDAADVLPAVELFSVTSTFMVPTHLERILTLDPSARRSHDTSSMRLLAHAGAPIRRDTKEEVMKLFPPNSVWEFYGSTENQATRISPDEWRRKPGSVGKPAPGAAILILDEDGAELPAGEVGEVWVKDPKQDRFEYWGDPAKTEAAWRGDAFTVGDLGYLDEDGYLFLTGRKHDTIISGGVNVYPQEVERVLATHPAVAEVVVYGEPHDEWGQQVVASVVPAPEQPLDPEHLRAWARERLAGFKCPRRIYVVDSLPRTPTGKLIRRPVDRS